MIYIFIGVVILTQIILLLFLYNTTSRLNLRISQNESYLKTYSEEMKQIKLLLKNEVAMANSDAYPVTKEHMPYVKYGEVINN